MIIGKYEEVYPPLLADYVAVCDNAFSRKEILEMEADILMVLNFDIAKGTVLSFLDHIFEKIPMENK